jgi:hypothetical protein
MHLLEIFGSSEHDNICCNGVNGTKHEEKKEYLATMSPGLEAGGESSGHREVRTAERMFERELHGFGIRGRGNIEIGPTAYRRADVSGIGQGSSDSLELVIVVL